MIYVMSDIHGQKRRFDSVMKQINLQPEDTLYVLGDVIDRNPDGIKILRQIMAMSNAKMLLGNHELMMMNALYYPPPEDEEWPEYYYERKQSLWYRNGGEITHNYLKHIKKTVRQEIFEYLEKLPVNMEITVNGRQFILTHAAPAELYETYGRKYECERDFAVWMRFDSFPVLEDCTVIFGHTPTIRFQYDNPMAIWDAKSWIGIDCGCMLPEKGDPWSGALGRLSCLQLDDMQVFYSEEPQYDNLKESEEQHYGRWQSYDYHRNRCRTAGAGNRGAKALWPHAGRSRGAVLRILCRPKDTGSCDYTSQKVESGTGSAREK